MKISRFTMNPFGMNCYILWSGPGGECIVIDPGMMTESEKEMITSFIDGNNLTLKHLLLTHCHVDHACAARWLATRYGVQVEAGEQEASYAQQMPVQGARFGEEIQVLETPGHSAGSLSFYCPSSSVIFTGDAVFQSSIGRTDLPGGSFPVLIDSINTKIMTLPADTVIASGHGDTTTVGDEKVYNPYLA